MMEEVTRNCVQILIFLQQAVYKLKKDMVTAFDKSFSQTCIANQNLHIFGKEIERVDRHEYLGIVVDRLSFKYHNNKCSSRVNNRIISTQEN